MRPFIIAVVLLASPAVADAQRVYMAPITDFAVGDVGPTRFEYITHFNEQESCASITLTNIQDRAAFEVWFEFEGAGVFDLTGSHFMMIWDAEEGGLVAMGNAVRSENIVSDACEAIIEYVRSEVYGPPTQTYESCEAMREAGWHLGVSEDGGTYQDDFDAGERDTYRLNQELDRNRDGRACNLS